MLIHVDSVSLLLIHYDSLRKFGASQSDLSGQAIWNTIGQEPRHRLEVNMFLLRVQFQHALIFAVCINAII